ncbi:MAG: cobalt-zinc-cadmium efflux system membrane fusion protein [Candidatus Krumholzibacteriia bacterium]|jgi:cobalt-zinc-cadmium efflux system membrane fusion protein
MLIRILMTLAMISLASLTNAADDHPHGEEEKVSLSKEEQLEFSIETAIAGPDTITTRLELPGEVQPNADLVAHIVSRYEGIVTEVRVHEGDLVKAGQVLAIVESDASLAPFPVKTLIAGTVIAKHIALGEAVSRDRSAFVVADLSLVWIELTVYQRDLQHIALGQMVQVFVGHDAAPELGRIDYLTPVVSEETRTATARLVMSNDNEFWRPGMFITANVLIAETIAEVVVPLTALQNYEGGAVVFVDTDEGFEPRTVTLGQRDETKVEILSGLNSGERYVSVGGFTLKAELGKSSFGGGHNH